MLCKFEHINSRVGPTDFGEFCFFPVNYHMEMPQNNSQVGRLLNRTGILEMWSSWCWLHFTQSLQLQGGPKKWGHYVWRLRSLHAHIFKMPEQISVIFGLLQCRYILNTSVDSIFIKFIIHVRAFWRCGHAKIWAFNRSGLTFLDHPVR